MDAKEALRVLGEQIRTSRIEAELTQDELGARAGIVGKYVSEIERGTRDVPLSTLHAIVERGLRLKLAVEFRPKNGSRPNLRIPLPGPVMEFAQVLADLPVDLRTRVLAVVRSITSLVRP